MLNFPRVVSSRYGVAIATVVLAYLTTKGLWPLMEPHSFSLFFAAVAFSVFQGGLGPGLLATALATILSLFLSHSVDHAFLLGFNDVLRLSVFVLVSLLINSLSVQLHTARQRAETNAIALQHQQAALQNVEGSRPMESAMSDLALEVIERNAKLQAQLVEDLLDVSRSLRGKLSLNVISVNLAAIVAAALETVRLSAEAKSIQIQIQLEQETGKVMGDPSRLQQVIWNLLSNAVKFTPQGGQIKVELKFVEQPDPGRPASTSTSEFDLPTYAQLTISDTGQGISAKFLPHIFDYFRQADSSTTRSFGGLGLGLAIARQIVELHGGTIQADSAGVGQGTTFTVRLPAQKNEGKCQENEHELQQNGAGSTQKAAQAVLQDLRILAVDDDDDTREFLGILLEQHGAVVATAASTFEALEYLEHHQPDILLSDIGMPEQDGYTFIRQVRSRSPQQGGNIPAIALTAYASESDRLKAIAAGFQKHLAKPIDPAELVAALTNLVQHKGS